MNPVTASLTYATDALFAAVGPELGKVILRQYVTSPNAATGRTSRTLAAGYPKTVDGIVAERRSGDGAAVKQVLLKGADLGAADLPDGEWTVQETAGGPELPIGEAFRPMGPDASGAILWKAQIGSGSKGRNA